MPDLCKDYKETGYCGYGDSCKFMHDRGDYKSGWQVHLTLHDHPGPIVVAIVSQIEREWKEEQEAKRRAAMSGETLEEEDFTIKETDDLPWACVICREPFKSPVVTKCGHYFCESCALTRYAKNTKCAACNTQTLGIFNVAHTMIEKLKRQAEADAKAAGEDGETITHPSEEDEEEISRSKHQGPGGRITQQGWYIP